MGYMDMNPMNPTETVMDDNDLIETSVDVDELDTVESVESVKTGETTDGDDTVDESFSDDDDDRDTNENDAEPGYLLSFYRNNRDAIRGVTLVVVGSLAIGAVTMIARSLRR